MILHKYDPAQSRLRKTRWNYEDIILQYIWDMDDEGAGSYQVWETVSRELGEDKSISQASVTSFLDKMVDASVLGSLDATSKGSKRRIYIAKLDESIFRRYIERTRLESVPEDFPKETEEILAS